MPTYTFRNTETNEIIEVSFKLSEYDSYVQSNPTFERYFGPGSAPSLGDPVRLGIRKKDAGFKEVLQKIKEQTTYADFDKTSCQL